MTTVAVVSAFDISKDGVFCFSAGVKMLTIDQFGFEGASETLHRCIVIAAAHSAEAGEHVMVSQQSLILAAGVLAALVGMVQQMIGVGGAEGSPFPAPPE
jgi:hypothetical protein